MASSDHSRSPTSARNRPVPSAPRQDLPRFGPMGAAVRTLQNMPRPQFANRWPTLHESLKLEDDWVWALAHRCANDVIQLRSLGKPGECWARWHRCRFPIQIRFKERWVRNYSDVLEMHDGPRQVGVNLALQQEERVWAKELEKKGTKKKRYNGRTGSSNKWEERS